MRFIASMLAVCGAYTAQAASIMTQISAEEVNINDPDTTDTSNEVGSGFGNGKNEPTPVIDLTYSKASDATNAYLSWTSGSQPKRTTAPINSYYVFARTNDAIPLSWDVNVPGHYQAPGSDWDSPNSFMITNLQKGTDYWLWVGAHNEDGTGSLTGLPKTTTLTTLPSPVVNINVGEATANSLKVTWGAPLDNGGLNLDGYTIYQRESFEDPTEADIVGKTAGGVFEFTSSNLIHGKTYFFWVSAENAEGSTLSTRNSGITLAEIPTPPHNVQFSGVTATGFTFTWVAPKDDGGAAISGYDVFISEGTEQSAQRTTPVTSGQHSYTVTGLTRYTTYSVFIVARNRVGSSAPSVAASKQTLSTAPTSVVVTAKADSAVQFTANWSTPSDDGGLGVDGYNVFVSQSNVRPPVATATVTETTHVAAELYRATAYFVWIQAFNSHGASPVSAFVQVNTHATEPSKPQLVVATTLASDLANLSWKEPADNGGKTITAYKIYVSTVSGEIGELTGTTAGSVTTFMAGSLYRSTKTFFTVIAQNAIGDSLPGDSAAAITFARASNPVAVPVTSNATPDSFDIKWLAPADDGGDPITAYHVYVKLSQDDPLATDFATYTVPDLFVKATGLTRATTYYVWVQAENAKGKSALSPRVSEDTLPAAPVGDLTLVAEAQSPFEISLTWQAPADNGGLEVIGYNINSGLVSADTFLANVNGQSFTYTNSNLNKFTQHFYAVSAVNAAGEGAASAADATTFATVPDSPAVTVDAITTNSFDAHWVAAADNGGSALTGYTVWIKTEISLPAADDLGIFVDATVTSHSFVGLNRGTSYTVFVAAVNAIGQSNFDNGSFTLVTLPSAPTAPTQLVFSQELDSNQNRDIARVAFQFDPHSDAANGGATVTSYTLYVAPQEATDLDNPIWKSHTISEGEPAFDGRVFTLLGAEFHSDSNKVWVTASNKAGESVRSVAWDNALWLCPKCAVCDVKCYGRTGNNKICPLPTDLYCSA